MTIDDDRSGGGAVAGGGGGGRRLRPRGGVSGAFRPVRPDSEVGLEDTENDMLDVTGKDVTLSHDVTLSQPMSRRCDETGVAGEKRKWQSANEVRDIKLSFGGLTD